MDNPLVSIVTPCYNGAPYLPRFFDSILNQTYKHLEVIFVDDGSQDDTKKVVDQYSSKFEDNNIEFIYIYQDNGGQASALNRGLKYFKGEFLSCVDSDDELGNNFVFNKLKYMLNNPRCHYCYGDVTELDHKTKKIIRLRKEIEYKSSFDFLNNVIYFKDIIFSGYMFRTSSFDRVIRNREIYDGPGGQNVQLLVPFSWYYGNPEYVEDSTYYYYIRSSSHSHSINDSFKIIDQINNYETILDNTISKIPDFTFSNEIKDYHIYFSKIKFGNAIDSKDSCLIKKYYKELKKHNCSSIKDYLLYVKYTNVLIRKLLKVGEQNV